MTSTSITLATLAATAALAASAAAASAPTVSGQRTFSGARSPVTIPGTGVHKGDRLPPRSTLVLRTVRISAGQRPTFTIVAPQGKTLRGLAPDGGPVGFVVTTKRSYVGRRTAAVRAYVSPGADGEATGIIYGLAR